MKEGGGDLDAVRVVLNDKRTNYDYYASSVVEKLEEEGINLANMAQHLRDMDPQEFDDMMEEIKPDGRRRNVSQPTEEVELELEPEPAPSPRQGRRVVFADSLRERGVDVDVDAALKGVDGPNVDTALLDRLVVAFVEKGNIRSAEGVVAFVGAPALEQSGPAVAQRLEAIIETLRSGSIVSILPSNVRLRPMHSVRLARLLEYLKEALG